MITPNAPLVIVGAGAIGCYLGTHWAAAGVPVTLLGRGSVQRFAHIGLQTTNGAILPAASFGDTIRLSDTPADLAGAGMILICVKSTALPTVIEHLQKYAPQNAPIICLLNGVAPIRDLRAALPDRQILAGMVPFNVVWQTENTLKRSSVGQVILEKGPATQYLAKATAHCPEPPALSTEISAVQHGKLLLNLNNPINALSGLSLYQQLRDRGYRRAYAAVLNEALQIFEAAGISHAKSGPLPAHRIVQTLRMPNWVFNSIALRLQRLDPQSQTSMAQDLAASKPTEIDSLNGEILRIAETMNHPAPINSAIVRLIKEAKSGGPKTYTSAALLSTLNL